MEANSLHILHVVGARPNFMKAAPVMAAAARRGGFHQTLVHTGQHYDAKMSDVFFRQLGLSQPNLDLAVGSGSHAVQTAEIMIRFEEVVQQMRPDLTLVYGDVNSTVAAALVCAKLGVPIGHVEAGLRSFDRTMPEEINRLLTDHMADLLFTPSVDADDNLLAEGIAPHKIYLVGNTMIDTLVRLLPRASATWARQGRGHQDREPYALVTLHRPSNVDDADTLIRIMSALTDIGRHLTILFPAHPRTRQRLASAGFEPADSAFQLVQPLGYLEFLALQQHATLVITDSGGVQEETTFLRVPCLTIRQHTERPITVTLGTNTLVGQNMDRLRAEVGRILAGQTKAGRVPPFWDGRAAERIVDGVQCWFEARR